MHPHSSAHIGRKINHSLHFSRSILQHHELGPCARPRGTQFLLSVARKIAQIRECCGARLPTPVPPSHSSSLADSVVVVLAAGDESRFGIQQVAVMPLPFSFSRYLSLFLSFFSASFPYFSFQLAPGAEEEAATFPLSASYFSSSRASIGARRMTDL